MRIHEVCKRLGVTKKAIEYYIKQDLLTLDVLDNGYRNFKEEHIERLRKIVMLRRLGLGTREIKQALSKPVALKHMVIKNELRLTYENARHTLLQRLSDGEAWEEIESELLAIEQQATITNKLLDAFPGKFGQFITLHFSHFLPNSITSEEQQAAYEEILLFLDESCTLDFPIEWQDAWRTEQPQSSIAIWRELSDNMIAAVNDAEQFLADHDETIRAYLTYKQSKQYEQSPAFYIQKLLKQFQETSGYYERFIPAMQRLSPAYREYMDKLEAAAKTLQVQLDSMNN